MFLLWRNKSIYHLQRYFFEVEKSKCTIVPQPITQKKSEMKRIQLYNVLIQNNPAQEASLEMQVSSTVIHWGYYNGIFTILKVLTENLHLKQPFKGEHALQVFLLNSDRFIFMLKSLFVTNFTSIRSKLIGHPEETPRHKALTNG